jgi:alkylation response protein AidB-like acyl-CoA dehydrogenase
MTEAELRERTRALLAESNPDDPQVSMVDFRGAQFDHGLAWVHFPEGHGGLGLEAKLQAVVYDELQKGAKTYYEPLGNNPIGIGMGAPVVNTYASEEQKKRLLRRIFTGEEIWCQLFSEPSAGSDVAGLATRAVRDGDDWLVSGQKVWTTLAHVAKWGMLLARTNPDVPKHDGLSYFLLDMKAPGVEVRPLYQITGEAEFNEVFMTDVRIPQDRMLGREGQGWRVAITTLMNERSALGGGSSRKGGGPITILMDLLKQGGAHRSPAEDARLRDRVTQLYIQSEMLRLTGIRARAATRSGGNPGPEGSVGKLAQSDLYMAIWECCADVMGDDALVYEPGYELRQAVRLGRDKTLTAKYQLLRSRANSIEGGTSEIMRNILGERVLGLPGEPRVDKEIPWKDVPRG